MFYHVLPCSTEVQRQIRYLAWILWIHLGARLCPSQFLKTLSEDAQFLFIVVLNDVKIMWSEYKRITGNHLKDLEIYWNILKCKFAVRGSTSFTSSNFHVFKDRQWAGLCAHACHTEASKQTVLATAGPNWLELFFDRYGSARRRFLCLQIGFFLDLFHGMTPGPFLKQCPCWAEPSDW